MTERRRKDTPFFTPSMTQVIQQAAEQFVDKQNEAAKAEPARPTTELPGFASAEQTLAFNFDRSGDVNTLTDAIASVSIGSKPPAAPKLSSSKSTSKANVESLASLTEHMRFKGRSPEVYQKLRDIAEEEEWETPYALLTRFEPVQQEDGTYSMPTEGVEVPSLDSGYYETEDIVQFIHLLAVAPTRKKMAAGSTDLWVTQLVVLKEQMLRDLGMLCCDKPGQLAAEEDYVGICRMVTALMRDRLQNDEKPVQLYDGETYEGEVFSDDDWEKIEYIYCILNELVNAEVSDEVRVEGFNQPMLVVMVQMMDSVDERERECVGDFFDSLWQYKCLQDSVANCIVNALWTIVYEQREVGGADKRSPMHKHINSRQTGISIAKTPVRGSYRLLKVLCLLLDSTDDEGNTIMPRATLERLVRLVPGMYSQPTADVHRFSGPLRISLHALVARLGRIDEEEGAGSGRKMSEGGETLQIGQQESRETAQLRLQGRLLRELVKRWPSGHLTKQLLLMHEVESIMPKMDQMQARLVWPSLAKCLIFSIRAQGHYEVGLKAITMFQGPVFRDYYCSDLPLLQELCSRLAAMAHDHWNFDTRARAGDLWVMLRRYVRQAQEELGIDPDEDENNASFDDDDMTDAAEKKLQEDEGDVYTADDGEGADEKYYLGPWVRKAMACSEQQYFYNRDTAQLLPESEFDPLLLGLQKKVEVEDMEMEEGVADGIFLSPGPDWVMQTVPYSGKKFWYNTATGEFKDVDGTDFEEANGGDGEEESEEDEESSEDDDELPSEVC